MKRYSALALLKAGLTGQRGWERALTLLREDDLTETEVEELVRRMRVFRASDSALLELQLALGARPHIEVKLAIAQLGLNDREVAVHKAHIDGRPGLAELRVGQRQHAQHGSE